MGLFNGYKPRGGGGTDKGQGVTVDNDRNVFVTGYFSGTSGFGRNSKTSVGISDAFIIRVDK